MKPNQLMKECWQGLDGPNLGYIHDQYEHFLQDPNSVENELRELFIQWGKPPLYEISRDMPQIVQASSEFMNKVVLAARFVEHIRRYGHLQAKVNSLQESTINTEYLMLTSLGLTEEDLKNIPAVIVWPQAPRHLKTGLEVIRYLREVYMGAISYQFTHIHNSQEREWLDQKVEVTVKGKFSDEQRLLMLKKLTVVEEFEHFLHKTFAGQKRFSIEGLEMLIPMLDEAIGMGSQDGVRAILIGMAHRGRLNVLAHVLKKPYQQIFSEFYHHPNSEHVPTETSLEINDGWTGDVKYHLGAEKEYGDVRLVLANNPSHLEFVGSVIQGYTRAVQEDRGSSGIPIQDASTAFSISIHGDAAFPGEGIVAETLNLSQLKGYGTGGTIHIIANNQVGFTTDCEDSRSTTYSSDLAKGFQIPIVHVNADEPEACLQAMKLAYEYRKTFKKDFLIEVIGFRRYGHNEMDDPMTTQPLLYDKINNHPGVRARYIEHLQKEGLMTEDLDKRYKEEIQSNFKAGYEQMRKEESIERKLGLSERGPVNSHFQPSASETVVHLQQLNKELQQWPTNFGIYPKLGKILQRRMEAFENGKVDWAMAEGLAFATILRDGTPIRLTGQDSERGTFAHRHLVLHDQQTGKPFIPLHHISGARASFAIHNSALSEAAVLGFEYGYDVLAKDTLVLWEAQFGDFVNAAQVIIDTFLVAGRSKWGQNSNLILLLPHGHEGQGPEHSSARPERFLQLAADDNMMIANPTSAAQYYHLLRNQASLVGTDKRRPLIILTPKGLLRHPQAISDVEEIAEGRFKPILEKVAPIQEATRMILCSGKIAIELEAEWEKDKQVHVVRVEQLYPFPEREIRNLLDKWGMIKEIYWVQEEPRNMGAWTYIEPRMRELTSIPTSYIGRPDRSSPAEGSPDAHKREQHRIIREALGIKA
ncbi:MAG TPA: 2-oxoglutarate dehydrogenase E1 component [Bacillota bacterium]|nr:2-oxoglutarate dehydrogenase E1 component [Bacillota bacterium]